jgi:hypothetical protein
MANVTNFGNGNFTITLPAAPSVGDVYVFTGYLYDNGGEHLVYARAEGSATMTIYYGGTNGQFAALSPTAPQTLDVTSEISLSGTYISAS